MHELPHALLHFDKGFIHTFISLNTNPGKMISGYVNGKRVGITPPLLFLFVCAGFLGLLAHQFPLGELDSEVGFLNNVEHAVDYCLHYYKWSFFLGFLCTGLISWLFYPKAGMNLMEHFIMNAFIGGSIAFYTLLLYPFALLANHGNGIAIIGLLHVALLQLYYPGRVYYLVFKNWPGRPEKGNILVAALCSLAGTIFFLAVIYQIMHLFH